MRAGALRRLARRVPLMAASLLLAVLFWFVVTAREQVEMGSLVPIAFTNLPSDVLIDGSPITSVYVRMRGPRQTVEGIQPLELQASVDLARAKPGRSVVHITPQSIALPQGVIVLTISPEFVELRFAARVGAGTLHP